MMRTTQDTGNDAQVMLGSSFGRPHQLGRLREVLAFLSFVAPWERAAGRQVHGSLGSQTTVRSQLPLQVGEVLVESIRRRGFACAYP